MFKLRHRSLLLGIVAAALVVGTGNGETPDQWVTLGARVHGAFGSFLPVGIRIGLDALARLDAKPREVTVVYYDSDTAPCACVADGVAIATVATVGQRTLEISPQKAPARWRSSSCAARRPARR
jgi:FmdE, Molybdenum formylmethanofuran dehydrogenase operon